MNHAHVRFTPYDLSGYNLSAFAEVYARYVIAHEVAAPGAGQQQKHFHIYVECAESEKTLRNRLLQSLQIPKNGRGKNNKYYCLKYNAYKDPSPAYICKDGDIIMSKGYTEEQLIQYQNEGKQQHGRQLIFDEDSDEASLVQQVFLSEPGISQATRVTQRQPIKLPRKTEFDLLLDSFKKQKLYKEWNMDKVRRWIMSDYLYREKPIPAYGNLARYSFSLWAIAQEKIDEWQMIDNRAEAALHDIKI